MAWIAFGLLAVFAFGWVTMQLWNWLIPVLFGGPTLTFWQALGLLLLSKMLFWGFGGKGGWHHRHQHGAHWREKYNKFASMTPEERAALKQKMKEKWCQWEENTSGKDSSTSND